ncbi:MAG: helix-turn-helix domain-containing protein [Bdellovibrionales bacterium]
MKNPPDFDIEELAKFWPHPELDELDDKLKEFRQSVVAATSGSSFKSQVMARSKISTNSAVTKFQSTNSTKKLWLSLLRTSLGLSAAGLAERLKMHRQAISQFEKSEEQETISLKTLRNIATSIDCEFVYGFVPKGHATFSEMITAKTLPHVQKPEIKTTTSQFQTNRTYGYRIKMFLSKPTGRGQIWQLKKAINRTYDWIWADTKQR